MSLYRIDIHPWYYGGMWNRQNPYWEWASLQRDTDAFEKTKSWLNAMYIVGYDSKEDYLKTKWRKKPICFQKNPLLAMKKAVKQFEKNIYAVSGFHYTVFMDSYEKAKEEAAMKCYREYGKIRKRDMDKILYSFVSYEPTEEDKAIIRERQKKDREFGYIDLLEERGERLWQVT